MPKRRSILVLYTGLTAALILGVFGIAFASFNEQINYQGKLTESNDVAVDDDDYCMKFLIHTAATGDTSIWSEEWKESTSKVTTVSGLFSVMLGSQATLDISFDQDPLYLEVQFDPGCDTTYEETFSPRKILGAVPAAFEAKQLGGKTWASPDAIGSTTPASGYFTYFSATDGTDTVDMFLSSYALYVDGSSGNMYSYFTGNSKSASLTSNTAAGEFYDGTNSVYLSDGTNAGLFQSSSDYVYILDGSYGVHSNTSGSGNMAGYFTDGTRIVGLADGTHAVEAISGPISIRSNNELRFYDNGNYVGFEAPALSANQIWVLPSVDGNSSDYLQTDGNGNLSWAAGGGGVFEEVGSVVRQATADAGWDEDFVFGSYQLADVNATYDSRFWFDESKSAFRAGIATGTEWDDSNVGSYSVAMGYNTTARGLSSVAIGSDTTASGDGSLAMGYSTTASGYAAVAMGHSTTASGDYSFAMGYQSVSSGDYSVAMGQSVNAYQDNSFAFGKDFTNNTASSFMVGFAATPTLRVIDGKVGIYRDASTNALEVEGNASKTTAETWLANSDIKIKTDIQDLNNALNIINQLHPVKFRYTDEYRAKHPSIEEGRYYYNFIAQEFQEIFPSSVKEGGDGYLQIETSGVQPYLIAAVQELTGRVDELKGIIGPLNENGSLGGGITINSSFIGKVKTILKSLGLIIEDGVAFIKDLTVEKLIVKKAIRINKMEMVDQATGQVYCTWIENGEWVKNKGSCIKIEGCMDSNALNYNPKATVNDGTCEYEIMGCTDSGAENYNSAATVDDNSCTYFIPSNIPSSNTTSTPAL